MNRVLSLLLALVLVAIPGALSAQACLGMPHASRGAVAASASVERVLTTYALAGTTALGSSLFVGALAGVMSFGGKARDLDNGTELGATLAYQLLSLGEHAGLCPRLDASYQSFGVQNVVRVSVGFNVGRTFSVGESETTTLTPYVTPQFVWTRMIEEDVRISTERTHFVLNAGATVGFRRLLLGAFVGRVLETGSQTAVGVQAGLAF